MIKIRVKLNEANPLNWLKDKFSKKEEPASEETPAPPPDEYSDKLDPNSIGSYFYIASDGNPDDFEKNLSNIVSWGKRVNIKIDYKEILQSYQNYVEDTSPELSNIHRAPKSRDPTDAGTVTPASHVPVNPSVRPSSGTSLTAKTSGSGNNLTDRRRAASFSDTTASPEDKDDLATVQKVIASRKSAPSNTSSGDGWGDNTPADPKTLEAWNENYKNRLSAYQKSVEGTISKIGVERTINALKVRNKEITDALQKGEIHQDNIMDAQTTLRLNTEKLKKLEKSELTPIAEPVPASANAEAPDPAKAEDPAKAGTPAPAKAVTPATTETPQDDPQKFHEQFNRAFENIQASEIAEIITEKGKFKATNMEDLAKRFVGIIIQPLRDKTKEDFQKYLASWKEFLDKTKITPLMYFDGDKVDMKFMHKGGSVGVYDDCVYKTVIPGVKLGDKLIDRANVITKDCPKSETTTETYIRPRMPKNIIKHHSLVGWRAR